MSINYAGPADCTVHPEFLDMTGDQLRAKSQASHKAASDSFDRCDTDGFLSQWASDSMGSLYHYAARLADNGWTAEMDALFDLDGNLLDAEQRAGKYGTSWMIRNGDGTVRWVSTSSARKGARRRAHYESKGVRVGRVSRRVVPVTWAGSGYNLTPGYITDRDHPEVTIVSTDSPGEDWS
jgi:hypothetical protein